MPRSAWSGSGAKQATQLDGGLQVGSALPLRREKTSSQSLLHPGTGSDPTVSLTATRAAYLSWRMFLEHSLLGGWSKYSEPPAPLLGISMEVGM